jgi:hypothetical protein
MYYLFIFMLFIVVLYKETMFQYDRPAIGRFII